MVSTRSRRGASTLETVIVSTCLALSFYLLGQTLFRIGCDAQAYAWLVLGLGLP